MVLAQFGAASVLPGGAVLWLLPAFTATLFVGGLLFLAIERPLSLAAGARTRPRPLQAAGKV
jgi:hypothetical protein